jgi:hypothetical protein
MILKKKSKYVFEKKKSKHDFEKKASMILKKKSKHDFEKKASMILNHDFSRPPPTTYRRLVKMI